MRRGVVLLAAGIGCGRVGFQNATRADDSGAPVESQPPACRALDPSWTPEWSQLVAYEPFDGSGAIDDGDSIPAIVGSTGAASNANGSGMTYTPGKVGQAIAFDGIDDYITLPVPNVDTTAGDSVSVAVWMRWNGMLNPSSPSTWTKLLLFDSPEYALVYADVGSGTTGFGFNTDNSDLRGTPASAFANTWVHVVGIFVNGASTTTQLYIDGQPHTVSDLLGMPQSDQVSTEMLVAALPSWPSYYTGEMDELAVWNAALSPDEIATIYAAQAQCP